MCSGFNGDLGPPLVLHEGDAVKLGFGVEALDHADGQAAIRACEVCKTWPVRG
jgi:hypothetical protein